MVHPLRAVLDLVDSFTTGPRALLSSPARGAPRIPGRSGDRRRKENQSCLERKPHCVVVAELPELRSRVVCGFQTD